MSYVTKNGALIVCGASPTDLGLWRAEKAGELFDIELTNPYKPSESARINYLIFTGKGESETLRDIVVNSSKFNVPRKNTNLEDKSKSTAGNFYYARKVCLSRFDGALGIVTQEWHWDPRTRFLAGRFFPGRWCDNPDLLAPDNRPQSDIENSKRMERIAYLRDRYYSLPLSTMGLFFIPYAATTEFLERKLLRK